LLNNYDCQGMVKKQIIYATQQVQTLHYKSEQMYPFEEFVTQLQSAYQMFEENGEAKTESAKITKLTKKIQNNHNYLQAILGIITTDDQYCNNFTAAVNKISYISICYVKGLPHDFWYISKTRMDRVLMVSEAVEEEAEALH
jgi:hypothetical protein